MGEALFKAKQDAKHRLLGIDGHAQGSLLPAQVALSWANPVNAGRLADFLVNLAHLDEFGFFARMSGLLAQAVVHQELSAIPGLRAQNPNHRAKAGELLHRLHGKPTTVFDKDNKFQAGQMPKSWCVAANYEPFDDKGATDLTGIGKHLILLRTL